MGARIQTMRPMLSVVAALAAVVPFATQNRQDPEVAWLDDLEHARQLASEQDKPLLVMFRCEP